METEKRIRAIVVTPTFNNARTLRGVLERVCALGLGVVVVNDGSTDETGEILAEMVKERPEIRVERHGENRGKAAALRTGFRAAGEMGFTHAATVDTDGQLDPEQIPALLERANEEPAALVLGYRDDSASDYPAHSRMGRRISNLLVYLESGARVEDSQCGLRVYPLEFVNKVTCRANRFGYETEIITRAGWAGHAMRQVPVRCRYLPEGERVSHFRPWMDSLRSVRMHTRLLGRAMWPWPHAKRAEKIGREGVERSAWGKFWDWVNPMRAMRELRGGEAGRVELATGIGVGIFIANMPVYGLQTVMAIYTARRLHLHPAAVVAGSQISTPPIGPAMVAGAIVIGHLLLHGTLPTWEEFDFSRLGVAGALRPLVMEWIVGAVMMGAAMGVAGFLVATAVFRTVQARA